MKNIKNIIFDLGGVFIEINYPATEKAFIDLGVTNFNELYNQHHASDLFEKLETGKYSAKEFYQAFRNVSRVSLTNGQIESAWNAMLGSFYLKHIDWLDEIKNQHNIYLFSNTNIIHYNAFQKIYNNEVGGKNFDDHFIKAYYSHDLGLRKPYPESFTVLLEKENLLAEETLFIDDTLKNIEGAKQAGLNTIYLQDPATLISSVQEYLTLPDEI